MNRREFTRGLATFGLAPALPLPSLGAASSGSVAVAATAEKMYFMGWYTARLNKTCSPDFLIRELNVRPDVANDIFAKLVETNTVSAPNALGVSRTVDPLADGYKRMTGKLARRAVGEPKPDAPHKPALEKSAPAPQGDESLSDAPVEELELAEHEDEAAQDEHLENEALEIDARLQVRSELS